MNERDDGKLEMRFRVVNGSRRTVVAKGEILEASFKLILMRVEVPHLRAPRCTSWTIIWYLLHGVANQASRKEAVLL